MHFPGVGRQGIKNVPWTSWCFWTEG